VHQLRSPLFAWSKCILGSSLVAMDTRDLMFKLKLSSLDLGMCLPEILNDNEPTKVRREHGESQNRASLLYHRQILFGLIPKGLLKMPSKVTIKDTYSKRCQIDA
jgi:hypothetical protein